MWLEAVKLLGPVVISKILGEKAAKDEPSKIVDAAVVTGAIKPEKAEEIKASLARTTDPEWSHLKIGFALMTGDLSAWVLGDDPSKVDTAPEAAAALLEKAVSMAPSGIGEAVKPFVDFVKKSVGSPTPLATAPSFSPDSQTPAAGAPLGGRTVLTGLKRVARAKRSVDYLTRTLRLANQEQLIQFRRDTDGLVYAHAGLLVELGFVADLMENGTDDEREALATACGFAG